MPAHEGEYDDLGLALEVEPRRLAGSGVRKGQPIPVPGVGVTRGRVIGVFVGDEPAADGALLGYKQRCAALEKGERDVGRDGGRRTLKLLHH